MPRPYQDNNDLSIGGDDEKLPYKKLSQLEPGTAYRVCKSWQQSKDFGDGIKVQVTLQLGDFSGSPLFNVNGNTKLKKMLLDSHVNSADEKWLLKVGETITTEKGYNVVSVDLYQGDPNEVCNDDEIPF